ncbi:MAG: hypothetical protein AAF617_05955 [Bacteroidota bacterium]
MKKLLILLFCLSFLGMFTACESNYVSHQNVGKHVFQILQTLDTTSKETFRNHFLVFEQLQKMVSTVNEGDKLIPKIAEMSPEAYNSDIEKIYNLIKQDTEKHSIRWKEIEFVDYKYQTTRNRSMTLNFGTLFFKNQQQNFQIYIYWLTDLQVSGLLGLGGLQPIQ